MLLLLFSCVSNAAVKKNKLVNPILGDNSYVIKYGHKPSLTSDNNLRIKTHLEYVENLLRQKDVSYLSMEFQIRRNYVLDLLHDYWTKGVFPKNYDYYDQRKPCFIDKDGTICAVGYLIEQTTNRHIVENINSKHKYDELLEMNDPILDKWIDKCGLTKQELAMIQPTYGGRTAALRFDYGYNNLHNMGCSILLYDYRLDLGETLIGSHSYGVGFDYLIKGNTSYFAPKLSAEAISRNMAIRANLLYLLNNGSNSLIFRPEFGVTILGYVDFVYGYNIVLNNSSNLPIRPKNQVSMNVRVPLSRQHLR